MADAGMVIIGAGEAGARAAVALRENGYEGSVTLLGEESHAPYERPPLSKAVMLSNEDPGRTTILTDDRLAEHTIAFIPDCPAVAIDRAARVVECRDGSRHPYEKLLIATGSRPRHLHVAGASHALYLRTFADALAMRDRLRPGARLAVIGGGFIGLEIAASAVERGCSVTVVDIAPRVLMRGVPEEVATLVAARHREAGVDFRLGVGIARIAGDPGAMSVILPDGEAIACDGVIAGVGAVPETALAHSADLDLDNGIKADETLRTSDRHIFVAGDCCSFPHPLYDGRRIRLEAWRNAQDQGTAVAKNMLGANLAYAAVPSFWSDQYDQTLQIVGLPDAGVTTVKREAGAAGVLFFHLAADGRLVAASGIGPAGKIARDIRLAEMLVEKRVAPDPVALATPDVRLKSLLPRGDA